MRMLASAVRPATVQVAWPQSLYVFSDVCVSLMYHVIYLMIGESSY